MVQAQQHAPGFGGLAGQQWVVNAYLLFLASLILVTELFREAQQVAAFSQEFMLLYLEAALVYWVICLGLASVQSVLEKRLDRYVAH